LALVHIINDTTEKTGILNLLKKRPGLKKEYQFKNRILVRCFCLTPVILVIWEAEIGRIMVQGQPRQIVSLTLSPK
jgi:hypothetical protein